MKVLCKIFGHKPPIYKQKGWWSPGEEYGCLRFPYRDNVGRVHCHVFAECARCGDNFTVARVHVVKEIAALVYDE